MSPNDQTGSCRFFLTKSDQGVGDDHAKRVAAMNHLLPDRRDVMPHLLHFGDRRVTCEVETIKIHLQANRPP